MSKTLLPEKIALQRAAEILGGQAALASLLGFEDRRNVWPWFNTDRRIPPEHCPIVERETRAKGHAVLCEELRPDVAWDVLRLQAGVAPPEAKTNKPRGATEKAQAAQGRTQSLKKYLTRTYPAVDRRHEKHPFDGPDRRHNEKHGG